MREVCHLFSLWKGEGLLKMANTYTLNIFCHCFVAGKLKEEMKITCIFGARAWWDIFQWTENILQDFIFTSGTEQEQL